MSQRVIVFLDDCILAATGKEGRFPRISKVERIGLQGYGDSFERWGRALDGLAEEWKSGEVGLVLPPAMCSARVLKLPYAKGKQLAGMAAREVTDSFRNEVADYSVVSTDKRDGVDICMGGVDAGQLEGFTFICKRAGIEIGGMSVPMEGYLRILRQMDSYWNSTSIYIFFEESSMVSVLCQNGRYLYSGRSRLFSEQGTLDFGTEIVRSISGILQFYASEKREIPITDVYYAGCPEEDFEVSMEGIKNLNLQAAPMRMSRRIQMPGNESAVDWISCIGAMIRYGKREKRIDLYQASRKLAGKGEVQEGMWRHLALPAAVFALCMLPVLGFAALNRALLGDIREKQDWIDSQEVQAKYGDYLALEQELARIQDGIRAVERTNENLSVYPEISSQVLRRIENAAGAGISCKITGYDASTGVLTFRANSREVIDVPGYILKLKNSGLFHTVDYTGYDYENDWYTLSLSCELEGKTSEEAKEAGIRASEGVTP